MDLNAVSRATIIRILKKIPLFFGLQDKEYELLINACGVVQTPAGMAVFREGEAGFDMFVVVSGAVDIVSHSSGLLHTMRPGEIFGEMAVVSTAHRSATAIASEEAVLLRMSRDDLDSLVGRAPRVSYLIMHNIAEVLAQRVIAGNERLGDLREERSE